MVLLVAKKLRGNPLGEVAVTGMIRDFPAGMLALGIGSMAGAAHRENDIPSTLAAVPQNHRCIIVN